MNRHHSSWLLGYFGCYSLRAAAAEHDVDLTRIIFLSTLFTISDPLQVIKSLLMSGRVESGVLDEGDSAGLLQDSFENHLIDMFLNVTHIKYITCTHSFKAALIAFLVTSWLNWPRHCMHVVYFALWYEMIQATARAGTFVRAMVEHALRAQHRFRARLTRAWRRGEVGAHVWNVSHLMWS